MPDSFRGDKGQGCAVVLEPNQLLVRRPIHQNSPNPQNSLGTSFERSIYHSQRV